MLTASARIAQVSVVKPVVADLDMAVTSPLSDKKCSCTRDHLRRASTAWSETAEVLSRSLGGARSTRHYTARGGSPVCCFASVFTKYAIQSS
jgi:hypothetical protein